MLCTCSNRRRCSTCSKCSKRIASVPHVASVASAASEATEASVATVASLACVTSVASVAHVACVALDCKTVGFFLKISKEIGKVWRKSLAHEQRASLTRAYLIEYAKIRKNTDCFAV